MQVADQPALQTTVGFSPGGVFIETDFQLATFG
jgi:hypothetical protein